MKNIFIGLLYENNEPSLTRFIAAIAFIVPLVAFLFVSLYLLLSGKEWTGYTTFSTATMGSGIAGGLTQLANKISNTFNGSSPGIPFIKNNTEVPK